MIDKSARQHYAIQGGGRNYLGKQKMVTAPKKWLSSPDHEPAELAYITEKEKDILIDLNLYDSLKDGKPNRGPSGIISLQGDMGGWSGGGGGGGGGWDPGAAARERAAREANERSRIQQEQQANLNAQKAAAAQQAAAQQAIGRSLHGGPSQPSGISPMQSMAMTGGIGSAGKSQKEVQASIDRDRASQNLGTSLHGGPEYDQNKVDLKKMIAQQQEEKYGPGADPTKMGETVKGPDLRTEREKEEDWERAQDWDLIKDMSAKGYDFDEIQGAVEKGLTQKAPTTDTRRQNLIDFGLRSIMPETGLERSLLSRAKSFMPDTKTGMMGNYIDQGKMFDPKKMATNYALSKMGLGWLNPALGIASLFGFKNPLANMGSRYALPYKKQPIPDDRGGDQNIMQASIEKFQPTDQQTAQMDEIMRKRQILQGYADKGALNERGMNTLTQMNQLINQYQVDPASIWGVT